MAAGTRDRMIEAAAELFRERGYDGTGFRDVVDRAGTARGVIYHHFPQGKAELGTEVALEVGGRLVAGLERVCAAATPDEALAWFLRVVEEDLVRAGARAGCPVAAVTLAADDEDGRLRAAGRAFFDRARTAVADCLARTGIPDDDARRWAALAVASAEGAIILCRAEGGAEPLRLVGEALAAALAELGPAARART